MDELKRTENKTFGPTDIVVLDGNHFVGCTFDGCEVAFHGGEFAHEGTTIGRPCNLTFHDAAHRTVLALNWFGYKVLNYLGQESKAQFPS
jgi:hypothetical protein